MSRMSAAIARSYAAVPVQTAYIPMAGGMDLVTAPIVRKPGTCRLAQNFEQNLFGGYRRIDGYEAFDGQPSPSDAQYTILAATITGAPAVGNTLTGATSGATGYIVSLPGSSFVLTKVSGTFANGENLNVGGPTVAVATAAPVLSGASTVALNATYNNLAADVYRADIGAVPGSGKILGVWMFNDVVYAFRNNAGATAAAMYKSSAAGWVLVDLGYELSFTSGGTTAIAEGDTITGATSAATGTVGRVILTSGTWAGGDAAGRLILTAQTGTFQAENLDVGASTNLATIAGDSTAITLQPSGRFEFTTTNFGGSTTTKRMYGCDGVSRGFEFDGSVFVPITTGMTADTPNHVFGHKNHLFFAFLSSVQHSSIGDPYTWSPVTGAGELAMGDNVSGFLELPGTSVGGALGIFTRNRVSVLYGSSTSDWNLVPYRDELGAFAYTIQDLGFPIFLDDRGITDLRTSQVYGNFSHSALSNGILPLLTQYKPLAVSSCMSRDLSQYRLFFTNGYGFYATVVGGKVIGIMEVLFPDVVRCLCSLEMNDGSEAIFFGSDSGWVYQMNKGTSFDGGAIEAYIYLSHNFLKTPRLNKRYRDASVEISGSGYAEFTFGYSLGYGDTLIEQPNTTVTNFSATIWDGFTWDSFVWDGVSLLPSVLNMDGTAENVSISIESNADYFVPFTVSGAIVHYTPRRTLRS